MAKTKEVATLSLEQLRSTVKEYVESVGMLLAARQFKVDKSTVSRFINGDKPPQPRLIRGMQVECKTSETLYSMPPVIPSKKDISRS